MHKTDQHFSKGTLSVADLPVPERWGMAGVFPGELGVYNREDVFTEKLRFVAQRGFHEAFASGEALVDPDHLRNMHAVRDEFGLGFQIGLHPDPTAHFQEETERLRRQTDRILECAPSLGIRLVPVVVPGGRHRFEREPSLEAQLDRLAELLLPVAGALSVAGIRPAIENHADYYVSDLVELCGRVPGLHLQLDTGNCFLIGERPDLLPDAVFPLVAATHFKDHFVRPNAKNLHFELTGATLGRGDVGLESLYHRLIHLHPDPASIHLTIEWVPDRSRPVADCLNDSLVFLQRLSGGRFTPIPFAP